ncbi:hypothetical protein AMJ44_10895 [candidate division WOR-1 bacterium DG_54_3]|uniref:Uncharacterized protein n=1 Tax=candidate division WOR-1 bacterium DG_54_3 TaxID=1703775 RepID=A0A0S7XRS8_UNCSA|nr:MAG: hypothetical protein AMJ44_10895 [candidate division WOR-1 bacterium DG_54_3]
MVLQWPKAEGKSFLAYLFRFPYLYGKGGGGLLPTKGPFLLMKKSGRKSFRFLNSYHSFYC